MNIIESQVENMIRNFTQIYIKGIKPIITDDSAFLSFVSTLTAIDALCGYRYEKGKNEDRFRGFVKLYFPKPYTEYVYDIWKFRNKIIHAFSPGRFALTHHHSELHLQKVEGGRIMLNAEDFYNDLVSAAQKYFSEVKTNPELQEILIKRLKSDYGGSIAIAPLKLEK